MTRRRMLSVLGVAAVLTMLLFPVYWMVIASVTPEARIFGAPTLLPRTIVLDHYRALFATRDFWTPIRNSLIVAALGDLAPEVAIQRQRLMIEMVLTSLALWTRRPDARTNEPARRFFVESLFDAVEGALKAPVSAETLAALKDVSKG